ncbi:hypothetical protein J6590_038849 [Homalodisca vitripennis]|nr:hypothetical protein J6590_038849 [Homalodisca vitripennis]
MKRFFECYFFMSALRGEWLLMMSSFTPPRLPVQWGTGSTSPVGASLRRLPPVSLPAQPPWTGYFDYCLCIAPEHRHEPVTHL